MSENQAVYPIAAMCRLLGISTSGYYAWAKRQPSQRTQANAALLRREGLVERIHEVAGPRGFREIFEELMRHGLVDEGELDRVLTGYAVLDPRIVKALGDGATSERRSGKRPVK